MQNILKAIIEEQINRQSEIERKEKTNDFFHHFHCFQSIFSFTLKNYLFPFLITCVEVYDRFATDWDHSNDK